MSNQQEQPQKPEQPDVAEIYGSQGNQGLYGQGQYDSEGRPDTRSSQVKKAQPDQQPSHTETRKKAKENQNGSQQ